MKTILITLLVSFFSQFLIGQNSVEVTITGFNSNKGAALIGLYDSENKWLKQIYKGHKSEIINNRATATFEDLPDGEYAISAFHDEDNDGEFDMILGFYPSEDYASSNNAPAKFGPPKWQDAKFILKNKSKEIQNITIF